MQSAATLTSLSSQITSGFVGTSQTQTEHVQWLKQTASEL